MPKKLSLRTATLMFESINAESHLYYNTKSGEFDYCNEYFSDKEDVERFKGGAWIDAPDQRDFDEYGIMEDFSGAITDPCKSELLRAALQGRGALRRFKATLHSIGLADEWYDFKRVAFAEAVKGWCAENNVEYIDDVDKPDPAERDRPEPVVMPDTLQAIHSRYSCRAFSGAMPSDEHLQMISQAALASPSGMNRQLWRVVVVKNKGLIADLDAEGMKNLAALSDKRMHERIMSRGGRLFYGAPCMIVVPIAQAVPAGAELFDCGIVAENIALAATALGIDSLICGLSAFSFSGDRREEFNRRLGFPEGYEIGIAVLLGYAAIPDGKPHKLDLDKLSVIE